MTLYLLALAFIFAGGLLSLAAWRRPRLAGGLAVAGCLTGCALGLAAAVTVFVSGQAVTVSYPWSVPWGAFSFELDLLTVFFMLPILVLSAVASIYGLGYMSHYAGRRSLGPSWFFFNLLVASMLLVVGARNGVLFLVAWEVMALASFFLVTFDDEKESVRQAGWTYLVATHLGTAFLLALFIMMAVRTGSMEFQSFAQLATVAPHLTGVAFALALVGFGTKAGFIPLHVWLPEAHPAAPSHVSALMSGVMIKTGIYGLLRITLLLGAPEPWWGWTLLAVGLVSGVLGVLMALAQHDLKRLLAYSSVENVGIIATGLGLGLLGLSYHQPMLAVLGFAGGLLHVFNHAMFKGLLFLAAGAVSQASHTLTIDRLGGLLKRLPWTGVTFLVGAVAVCGLPPLNGFVSEFMLYLGSFKTVAATHADRLGLTVAAVTDATGQTVATVTDTAGRAMAQVTAATGPAGAGLSGESFNQALPAVAGLATIAGLALIGGLAAACFTKAFGIAFLGEPRSDQAAAAREVGPAMRWPMVALAVICGALGLLGPILLFQMRGLLVAVTGLSLEIVQTIVEPAAWSSAYVTVGLALLLAMIGLVAFVRRRMLAGQRLGQAGTWNCGYVRSSPRIQYTASSFAEPLTNLFRAFIGMRKTVTAPPGPFPPAAAVSSRAPDIFRDWLYRPIFVGTAHLLARLRWLQHGQLQVYVLYVALTLLVLLIWKLR